MDSIVNHSIHDGFALIKYFIRLNSFEAEATNVKLILNEHKDEILIVFVQSDRFGGTNFWVLRDLNANNQMIN